MLFQFLHHTTDRTSLKLCTSVWKAYVGRMTFGWMFLLILRPIKNIHFVFLTLSFLFYSLTHVNSLRQKTTIVFIHNTLAYRHRYLKRDIEQVTKYNVIGIHFVLTVSFRSQSLLGK